MIYAIWIHFRPIKMFADVPLPSATRVNRCNLFCFVVSSTPPGGKVESNGIAVGTTPFDKDYPGGYFHKSKTAVGSRLGHSPVARLSADGYSIKEIVLTEGPAEWISLKGRNYGNYFLFTTKHFDVRLDSVIATFAGGIADKSS